MLILQGCIIKFLSNSIIKIFEISAIAFLLSSTNFSKTWIWIYLESFHPQKILYENVFLYSRCISLWTFVRLQLGVVDHSNFWFPYVFCFTSNKYGKKIIFGLLFYFKVWYKNNTKLSTTEGKKYALLYYSKVLSQK